MTSNSSAYDYPRLSKSVLAAAFLGSVAVQLADWHSTFSALDAGRSETNPFILWLAGHVGVKSAVTIFKCVALPLTGVYFLQARRSLSSAHTVFLAATVLFYLPVVINNYS